jgi:hypothetical protein
VFNAGNHAVAIINTPVDIVVVAMESKAMETDETNYISNVHARSVKLGQLLQYSQEGCEYHLPGLNVRPQL